MPSRILLPDIDNCPDQLALLPESLEGVTKAVACHGAQEPKLPLSLVRSLVPALQDGRLEIVGMARAGKSAADFGLAFHAGRLLAELPQDTEFLIVSKDTGLDLVVDMLRRAGRKASRMQGGEGSAATPARSPDSAFAKACAFLASNSSRPRKRSTLRNAIKQRVPPEANLDQIIEKLFARGVVREDANGRLAYAGEQEKNDADIPF